MNKKYQYSIMYVVAETFVDLVDRLNEIDDGEVFQVTEYRPGWYAIYIRHVVEVSF